MSENENQVISGDERAEWVAIIRGRAAFYEFFSLAYRKPAEEDFLDIIKQFEPHFQASAKEIGSEPLIKGANKLTEFVNTMDEDKDLLSTLNRSYTSLFLLGGSSVPTSESVYLSPDKLMKQQPWEDVMREYASHKFGIPVSFKEPEDHISIELLFMYFLAEKAAKALEAGNDDEAIDMLNAQKKFMDEHLYRWAGIFSDAVIMKAGAHVKMLDAVTMLLKGFIAYDKEFLDTMTAE